MAVDQRVSTGSIWQQLEGVQVNQRVSTGNIGQQLEAVQVDQRGSPGNMRQQLEGVHTLEIHCRMMVNPRRLYISIHKLGLENREHSSAGGRPGRRPGHRVSIVI